MSTTDAVERNNGGLNIEKTQKANIQLTFLSDNSTPNTTNNKTPAEIDEITLYSKDPDYEGEDNYFPDDDDSIGSDFSDLDH